MSSGDNERRTYPWNLLPAACFVMALGNFYHFTIAASTFVGGLGGGSSYYWLQDTMAMIPLALIWGTIWAFAGWWVGETIWTSILVGSALAWLVLLFHETGSGFGWAAALLFGVSAIGIGDAAGRLISKTESRHGVAEEYSSSVLCGIAFVFVSISLGWWVMMCGGSHVQHSTDYTLAMSLWFLLMFPFLPSVWLLGYAFPRILASGRRVCRSNLLHIVAILPIIALPISLMVIIGVGHKVERFESEVLPRFLSYLGREIAPLPYDRSSIPSARVHFIPLNSVQISGIRASEAWELPSLSGIRVEMGDSLIPLNWTERNGLASVKWEQRSELTGIAASAWLVYKAQTDNQGKQSGSPGVSGGVDRRNRDYILDRIRAGRTLRNANWQPYGSAWYAKIRISGRDLHAYVMPGETVLVSQAD